MDTPTRATEGVSGEVRVAMARKRTTQHQLAAALGRSQAYVWRRLAGELPWDVADLAEIAKYLDVTLASLIPPEPTAQTARPA